MSRFIKIIILILSFAFGSLLMAGNSHAMIPKFEVPSSLATATSGITKILKTAQKRYEASALAKNIKNLGEGYKSFEGSMKKAQAKFEAERRGLAEAQDIIRGEATAGQEFYEQEKAKLQAKAQGLGEIDKLKEQKAEIEATTIAQIALMRSESNSKQKVITERNSVLQAIAADNTIDEEQRQDALDEIAANNNNQFAAQTLLASNIAEVTNIKDEQIKVIDDKIKDIRGELVSIGYNAGKDVAEAIFAKTKAKASEANEEVANELFLTKNQVASSKNIDALIVNRNKSAFDNNIDAFTHALEAKRKIGAYMDKAEGMQESVAKLDGSTDAIAQDTLFKVEQMKIIIDFLRIKVFALKAETSAELAKMSIYRRMDYDSDQGVLDLCNYRPSEEQKAAALEKAKKYFGVK